MSFVSYLKEHTIIKGTLLQTAQGPEFAEAIFDNPEEVLKMIFDNSCSISEVLWWHRLAVDTASDIGYGGYLDPRDNNFYFAETYICDKFDEKITFEECITYINTVKKKYSKYDIYPGFDVRLTTESLQ